MVRQEMADEYAAGSGAWPALCFRALILAALAVLALGCARFQDGRVTAESIAEAGAFSRLEFQAKPFILTGYLKDAASTDVGAGPDIPLSVYIEGDGRAYLSKKRPSSDPTPRNPMGLKLAVSDPSPQVLYLARPCQYTDQSDPASQRGCRQEYWTFFRFAPEVVSSASLALDQAKRMTGATRLRLIGYSGGGVLAALLAARRDDVASLVTVAAPLDLALWTRLGDVTPLFGSLSPMDCLDDLAKIPQMHFAGKDDDIVPPEVIRSYVDALGPNADVQLAVLPGYDHSCCWDEDWPEFERRFFSWLTVLERSGASR